MSDRVNLPLLNLDEARYECTFGRGCDGICCKNGKPNLFLDEVKRIDVALDQILPRLRPEARRVTQHKGYLDGRSHPERPAVRIVAGWCVFFNKGCVLHSLGAEQGDKTKFKPRECTWFPLSDDNKGNWYVRQTGYLEEAWDLFCLNPTNSNRPASETLQDEMAFVRRYLDEQQKKARRSPGSASQKK